MKTFKYLFAFLAIAAIASADPVVLTTRIGELDATVNQTGSAENGWVTAEVTEADGVLTGVTVTVDDSKYEAAGAVTSATNALDSTATQTAGTDGLALSVTQTDGKITAISGSIAANTYDASGAASTAKSEVIGQDGDASTANTIYGAKAYADSVAAAQDITIAEGTTDGTISVTKGEAAAVDVPVHGLGSAAYTDSTDYDAAGTASDLIDALDASVSQTAGTDGLAITVTQTNGVVTGVSGSIAANTYDAYGAASAVQGNTAETVAGLDTRVTALEGADPSDDIDARIILAITNGITVNGVSYKLVVDPAD